MSSTYHPTATAYWNEALETKPWAEVERWQVPQIEAMLGPLRERSALYERLYADVPQTFSLGSFGDLASLPFTMKEHIREVRAQLQVRVAITVLESGSLPRSAYKNSLLAVRAGATLSRS